MPKKTNIELQKLEANDQAIVLDIIRGDEELRNTFLGMRNTITRIANSGYTALIKKGSTIVGFIMLVYNFETGKYEIDLGILEKYRYMGYGSQALAQLKQIILNQHEKLDIEIQTSRINEPAIRSIVKNGFELYKEDKNYYYFKLPGEAKKLK